MTAGYSGTPLPQKLGVKPGSRVLLDGAPEHFDLDGVDVHRRPGMAAYDIVLLFAPDRRRLERRWAPLVCAIDDTWSGLAFVRRLVDRD